MLSVYTIFVYLMTLLILINCWMIQTVYTNRYGKNSLFNMVIMFINMAMMLFMSNMMTRDWSDYFHYFCIAVGILTLSLFIQYLIEYFRDTTDECNRQSIKSFLWMTGIRTLGLFLCVFLPYKTGIVLYLLVVIGTFIMPIIMIRGENHFFQVNFPHLIERISLLVIIIFGEMIVGLANFFKVETFSLSSVLYFVMMVMLFLFYFAQFDHAIDERANTKGLFLIYSHYPIFISLFMVTVSMGFLVDSSANHLFVTAFFLAGIGMFQAAVLANGRYNKDYLRYTKSFCMTQAVLFALGSIFALLMSGTPTLVIVIGTVTTVMTGIHFMRFYMIQARKNGKQNWHLI